MAITLWVVGIAVLCIAYRFLVYPAKYLSVRELTNFRSGFDENEKVIFTEFDVKFQEGLVRPTYYSLHGEFFSVKEMTESSVRSILSMTERKTYHALKHGLNSPAGRCSMQYLGEYSIHFTLIRHADHRQ